MRVLGLDIGSSSVKAAVLTGPRVPKQIEHEGYTTDFGDGRAEIPVERITRAIKKAISRLDVKWIDYIIPTGMAPSWIAMDDRGRALSPVITHQDKRSIAEAHEIEKAIGRSRHLKIAGNRPVPGGISSTSCRWFAKHHKSDFRRVDLVGHLNTYLLRQWCDARAIDPSSASFTGIYKTTTLGGWDDRLADAAMVPAKALPQVIEGHQVAGHVTSRAASAFGLPKGIPVLAGVIDGSCPMLLAGAAVGQAVQVVGSTDVLAVCVDQARPMEGLLTRALGVGQKWVSVGTLAAAGTAVAWLRRTMFSDLTNDAFWKLIRKIGPDQKTAVSFSNYLAGSRTEIDVPSATISGLTLACNREDVLAALLGDLRRSSTERLERFRAAGVKISGKSILTTGGGDSTLAPILRCDFPKAWKYHHRNEATLAGVWKLAQLAAG